MLIALLFSLSLSSAGKGKLGQLPKPMLPRVSDEIRWVVGEGWLTFSLPFLLHFSFCLTRKSTKSRQKRVDLKKVCVHVWSLEMAPEKVEKERKVGHEGHTASVCDEGKGARTSKFSSPKVISQSGNNLSADLDNSWKA